MAAAPVLPEDVTGEYVSGRDVVLPSPPSAHLRPLPTSPDLRTMTLWLHRVGSPSQNLGSAVFIRPTGVSWVPG